MTNYSVIIPHFSKTNTELLERAVKSIPVRNDLEVIVVDNSIIPVAQELFHTRPNVSVLYSDNQRGAGGARNVGLKNAHGRWLLFMDADDYFVEGAFDVFDRYQDSEYDIIFFKPTSVYSDRENVMADRHYVFCDEIDDYLKTNNEYALRYREFDVPWAKMIKRSLVLNNKIYFDEVPASNDIMFSLKTGMAAKKIYAVDATVYCVTVTKGSITNVISLRNLESVFDVRIRKNAFLKKQGLKKECSLLNLILKSRKYGVKIFFRFLWKAIITGNLLVGWNRWLNTFMNMKKMKAEYIVVE